MRTIIADAKNLRRKRPPLKLNYQREEEKEKQEQGRQTVQGEGKGKRQKKRNQKRATEKVLIAPLSGGQVAICTFFYPDTKFERKRKKTVERGEKAGGAARGG